MVYKFPAQAIETEPHYSVPTTPPPLLLPHYKDFGAKGVRGGVALSGHLLSPGTLFLRS